MRQCVFLEETALLSYKSPSTFSHVVSNATLLKRRFWLIPVLVDGAFEDLAAGRLGG